MSIWSRLTGRRYSAVDAEDNEFVNPEGISKKVVGCGQSIFRQCHAGEVWWEAAMVKKWVFRTEKTIFFFSQETYCL